MGIFSFSFCNSGQNYGFDKDGYNGIVRKNNWVQAVYWYPLKVGHATNCLISREFTPC